jgi:hypothetical protein
LQTLLHLGLLNTEHEAFTRVSAAALVLESAHSTLKRASMYATVLGIRHQRHRRLHRTIFRQCTRDPARPAADLGPETARGRICMLQPTKTGSEIDRQRLIIVVRMDRSCIDSTPSSRPCYRLNGCIIGRTAPRLSHAAMVTQTMAGVMSFIDSPLVIHTYPPTTIQRTRNTWNAGTTQKDNVRKENKGIRIAG